MDSGTLFFLRVQVWAMFLQAATFGVYSITCAYCLRSFFAKRSRHRGLTELNWPMLIIFLIFLLKAASHASISIYLNFEMATSDTREDAAMEFMDRTDLVNIAREVTLLIQIVIASGVLVYRCWLVYNRAWLVVALPLVLWLGGVAMMGITIHIDSDVQTTGIFAISQSRTFTSAFCAIIMAVNIIASALIIRRIWGVDPSMSQPSLHSVLDQSATPTAKRSNASALTNQSNGTAKQATRIIVESGLIYTTMTVITFLLFVANTYVVYAAIDVLVQATGISFNLMILRNRPYDDISESADSLSNLNGLPLQFVSSNMSMPGSAIEFAFPKHFMPRRKTKFRPATAPALGDAGELSPSDLPHNHSSQSI